MNSEKKIIDKLLNELYPIMRSITGEGNRETNKLYSESDEKD